MALVLIMSLAVSVPVSAQDQPVGLQVDSLAVGDEAPLWGMRRMGTADFVFLRDFAGELRTEARLRGESQKNVVLSFFASWCKPCPDEMAMLTQIAREYEGREIVFFFINFAETDQTAEEWLSRHPDIEGDILMDSFLVTAKKYGAAILPRTIIIDKNRIVRFIEQGFDEEHYRADITGAIDMLLAEDAPAQPEIPPN
jgi:thiol-disulfide isomerase/thioredoxin